MKDYRIDGVGRRMGYSNGFNVSPIGRAGGLSLWWDNVLEVEIIYLSKHIIDARVKEEGTQLWIRVTAVYGTPYRSEKADFWNWMSNHFLPSSLPWLCGGDFNEFMWDSEKSGGAHVLYNQAQVP